MAEIFPDPEQTLVQLLQHWVPDLVGTLLFVVDGERVLLIDKKRGHGAGRINGPGGKLEPGESLPECALRETLEETGIAAAAPVLKGRFKFVDRVQPQWLGYIFVATQYSGSAVETAEARPMWLKKDEIPYQRMWEDDRYWLPRVLAGECLEGEFLFDDGRLLTHRLRSVSEITI
jgi:8-oxo-dGTP diphosphatase